MYVCVCGCVRATARVEKSGPTSTSSARLSEIATGQVTTRLEAIEDPYIHERTNTLRRLRAAPVASLLSVELLRPRAQQDCVPRLRAELRHVCAGALRALCKIVFGHALSVLVHFHHLWLVRRHLHIDIHTYIHACCTIVSPIAR